MNEDPRFVCRREGHDPQATITANPAGLVGNYITACKRCGTFIELPLPEKESPVRPVSA